MTPEQAASVLHLERPWTPSAIKKAYKLRSRDTHPDLNPGSDGSAFKQVGEARAVLDSYVASLGGSSSFSSDSVSDTEEDWSDEDEEDLPLNVWFEVLSFCVQGHSPIDVPCRAQLVELELKTTNLFGEAIRHHYLIAVYPKWPIRIPGHTVEVALREPGGPVSVFIRRITQRSYEMDGRVNAFWFDPLDDPIVYETNVHTHGSWWNFEE